MDLDKYGPADSQVVWKTYAVGFFDLLGQSKALDQLAEMPLNQVQKDHFRDRATEVIVALAEFRKSFQNQYDAWNSDLSVDLRQQLSKEQLNELESARKFELCFRGISDCIVASTPLAPDGQSLQLRGLCALIAAAAAIMPVFLSMRKPFRGGIAIGPTTVIFDGEIYGYPLRRAYFIESRIASYPRVVVDEEVVRVLTGIAKRANASVREIAESELARSALQLLARDSDGCTIVDYFGPQMRRVARRVARADTLSHERLVMESYQFALDCRRDFAAQGNYELAGRYHALCEYIESRCWDTLGLASLWDFGTLE